MLKKSVYRKKYIILLDCYKSGSLRTANNKAPSPKLTFDLESRGSNKQPNYTPLQFPYRATLPFGCCTKTK